MNDRDDLRQPQDHLPPAAERDIADTPEEPHYPVDDPGHGGHGGSGVSPATAAEPEKPARHGVAKMPPGVG